MINRNRTFAFALLLLFASLPYAASAQRPRAKAQGSTARYVKQEEVVTFPSSGAVRVRAVEVPWRRPQLELSSMTTGRRLLVAQVGTSDPESFIREPGPTLINPLVRFMLIRGEAALPDPLILAVAVRPGGSDHGFELTLIGEMGGALRVLTPRPASHVSIQGGYFVGDLGRGRGYGYASWSFIWEDGAHYDRHRYEVRLYPFDERRGGFRRTVTMQSKGKYKTGEDALEELGLPRYLNLLDRFPAIADYRN